MTKVIVEPSNGLAVEGLGYLKHGVHELKLTAEQEAAIKEAEGIKIAKPKGQGNAKPKDQGNAKPKDETQAKGN